MKITGHKIKVFAAQLLIGLLFGVLFFILEEIGQGWLVTATSSCCERCSNLRKYALRLMPEAVNFTLDELEAAIWTFAAE